MGNRTKKRKKKKKKAGILFARLLVTGLTFFALIFLLIGNHYCKTHFIKGTIINEIDASGMKISELESQMRRYQITVRERTVTGNYITEVITGDQIGVTVANTPKLAEILKQQNIVKALIKTARGQESRYEVEGLYGYVDDALILAVMKLQGFREGFFLEPTDACLTDYDPEKGYELIEQTEGNQLNSTKTVSVIHHAVDALLPEVDLDEMDCYEKPKVYADDARLQKLYEQLKAYTDVRIVYHFGDTDEVIDGALIDGWLKTDEESYEVSLDREKVDAYVIGLRKKYDTIFRSRNFKTSYGSTVTVSGGDYGWWMDYEKEQEELFAMIDRHESGERVPVYRQTAQAYGERDYGDTYVEVNLSGQHLFLYVDGKRVMESDFVSGNKARGNETPEGVYGLTYKEMDAMLVGEDYETPVSYWMPFNKNIGLHDAIWRAQFGGQLYQTGGSHGCVNLPYKAAKQIYSYVSKGTPVICYHLQGTEKTSVVSQTEQDKAQAAIDAIDKIGTVTKDSEKKIKRARQLYTEVGALAQEYVSNYDTLKAAEEAFKALQR